MLQVVLNTRRAQQVELAEHMSKTMGRQQQRRAYHQWKLLVVAAAAVHVCLVCVPGFLHIIRTAALCMFLFMFVHCDVEAHRGMS